MPCFLVIQGILKALFSLIPWLLIFSDLPNYGSNSRKRYTIRILSKRRQRQAVESPKSWNSMGYICLKTTFLHLKHYSQIYLTLLSTDLWFGKWHEEYGKFFPEHSKLGFWWDLLIQTWKNMSLKSTDELSAMTMKNFIKFKEEQTCHFKVDMKNLTNFDLSTQKSQRFSL